MVEVLSYLHKTALPVTLRWGSELLLFYNDAYIPLIGDSHPVALGKTYPRKLSGDHGDLPPDSEAGAGWRTDRFREPYIVQHLPFDRPRTSWPQQSVL